MSAVWAVTPAGGVSRRFTAEGGENKLLALLGGVPVLVRTMRALMAASAIEGVVAAAHPDWLETYASLLETARLPKPFLLVSGGKTRDQSVKNALLALPPEVAVVAIHDAARPLVSPALIDRVTATVRQGAVGAMAALPVTDTLKSAQPGCHPPTIAGTVDRAGLWRAQTPQVFRKAALLEAYERLPAGAASTDDAQILELAGMDGVALVEGEARNLKVTRPEDLQLAEALLALAPPDQAELFPAG